MRPMMAMLLLLGACEGAVMCGGGPADADPLDVQAEEILADFEEAHGPESREAAWEAGEAVALEVVLEPGALQDYDGAGCIGATWTARAEAWLELVTEDGLLDERFDGLLEVSRHGEGAFEGLLAARHLRGSLQAPEGERLDGLRVAVHFPEDGQSEGEVFLRLGSGDDVGETLLLAW